MPIKIPNQLPATDILRSENIFVMTEARAASQGIRPLKVLLLNLMPKKSRRKPNFYVCSLIVRYKLILNYCV